MHVVQFFALGSGLRRPSRATHSCAKFQAAVPRAARTGPASRAERVSQRLRQARVATRALCRMVRHCLRFRAKRRGWPGQPAEDSVLLLALRSAASGRRVLHHDRPRQNIGDHTSNGPCVPRSGCGENSTRTSRLLRRSTRRHPRGRTRRSAQQPEEAGHDRGLDRSTRPPTIPSGTADGSGQRPLPKASSGRSCPCSPSLRRPWPCPAWRSRGQRHRASAAQASPIGASRGSLRMVRETFLGHVCGMLQHDSAAAD